MNQSSPRLTVVAAVVAGVLALGAIAPVQAQGAREQRRTERQSGKKDTAQQAAAEQYPNATRKAPGVKASAKAGPKLQKIIDLYNDDKSAEARTLADEVLANSAFNAYDHAFAAQMAAQAAYGTDDLTAAIAYITKAIQLNALDNNNHFNSMLMLAQMQLSEDATLAQGLASMDRFLTESGSTNPDHLAIKGQALFQLEKYPEAAAIFQKLVETNPEPKDQWLSLLMSSYAETGKTAEAIALAEKIAAKDPADKKKQMNLAAVYAQADQYDKAAGVFEKMRAAGQLTEDRDYRQLYSAYLNQDGKEKQAADVIKEGLDKGVLKPDHQAYLALAQSYYFSEQPVPAIDAYRKAAPLDDDGETYLNLARLLWQEDRIPEAKEAAKQAIAKGLKKPDDAKKILALPAK